MTGSKEEYVGFLCFAKPKKDDPDSGAIFCKTLEQTEQWKLKVQDDSYKLEIGNSSENKTEASHEKLPWQQLSELMHRFQISISGYRTITTNVLAIYPILQTVYLEKEMLVDIEKTTAKISDDGSFATFGIYNTDLSKVMRHLERLQDMSSAKAVIPGAILLSLVATFDSLIVDLIKTMIMALPERLRSSDKKMAISDILSMNSFDDVITRLIDDEVSNVMRESHLKQIEYIERTFNVSFPKEKHEKWGEFVEIFERRNLVAHGDLLINATYLSNCQKSNFTTADMKIGDKLELTPNYLNRSADTLIEIGIELICLLWKQNFKNEITKAYEELNNITYELITKRRYRLSSRLIEFAIVKSKAPINDRLLKMFTINLANAYKNLEETEKASNLIEQTDWSAATDDFQICVLSLKEDVDGVVKLMPRIAASDSLKKECYREWPVFSWVRDDSKFSGAFSKIYGEDLSQDNSTVTARGASALIANTPNTNEQKLSNDLEAPPPSDLKH
ncbi:MULTISPECIES: hypothetical protein [unclassified Beijerinckia]|uniref:hypothetical protein n=1 Tax=unclassified Beijerinckia TaxID=2638183 RepID=UPI000895C74A|nr:MULTISPECIES: hypothetical protein [unclassified Beijerinckia]MDH7794872.1 hypothetical protein [Beijerinckia sp. GAS462]SEB78641.1 hypothetical protein SAMN05443249_1146 [Beijerinckia sp. 28-YEA-48]